MQQIQSQLRATATNPPPFSQNQTKESYGVCFQMRDTGNACSETTADLPMVQPPVRQRDRAVGMDLGMGGTRTPAQPAEEAKAATCAGIGQKEIVGEIRGSAGFYMAKKHAEERRFAGTSHGATAHEARTVGSPTRERPQLVYEEREEDQAEVQPRAPRQQHRVPQRYEKQRWSPHTPHGNGQARSEA